MNWQKDREYETVTLAKVEREGDGVVLTREDGWSFYVPSPPFIPEAGDTARYYGRGLGHTVRGVVVEGKGALLYRTPEQQRELDEAQQRKWQAEREARAREQGATWDRMIAKLPAVVRERIDGFEARSPSFRVEAMEYELCIARAAVRIADEFWGDPDALQNWAATPWEAQEKRFVVDVDGEMSGNQVGLAKRLAYLILTDPKRVPREHAGLCPIVGCEVAGCWRVE